MTIGEFVRDLLAQYPADLELRINDAEYGFCNFTTFKTSHPATPWVVLQPEDPRRKR